MESTHLCSSSRVGREGSCTGAFIFLRLNLPPCFARQAMIFHAAGADIIQSLLHIPSAKKPRSLPIPVHRLPRLTLLSYTQRTKASAANLQLKPLKNLPVSFPHLSHPEQVACNRCILKGIPRNRKTLHGIYGPWWGWISISVRKSTCGISHWRGTVRTCLPRNCPAALLATEHPRGSSGLQVAAGSILSHLLRQCTDVCGEQGRAPRKGSCPLSRAQRKACTPIKGRDVLATLGSSKEALVQWEGSAGPASWWPNKTPCSGRGRTLPWCVLQHCSPGLADCSTRDEDHKVCWNFRQNKLSKPDPAHNAGHDIDGPFEKENSLQLEDNYGNNNTQSVSINTVSRAVDQYCINGWRKTSHTHQSAVKTSRKAETEEVAVGGCNRAQALDIFAQPAQVSPFYKPNATTIFQTHSLAACPGVSCSSPQPFTVSLHSEMAKGAQSLQGTFPMGGAWYSSVWLNSSFQHKAGPPAQREAMQKAQGQLRSKHIRSQASPPIPCVSSKLLLLTLQCHLQTWELCATTVLSKSKRHQEAFPNYWY